MKSSSFNNENGTRVDRESQLRDMKHSVDIRKTFMDMHRDRTKLVVDDRLSYLYHKWDESHLRSLVGYKKATFEDWLKHQFILQVWPDGTKLDEDRAEKVFGLVAESLEFIVNNEFVVKLKPNNGWLAVESIDLKR